MLYIFLWNYECLLELLEVLHHLFSAKHINIINVHNPSKIFTSGYFFNRFCFLCHLLSLALKLLCVKEILNLFRPIWFLFHKNLRVSFLIAATAYQRLMSGGWEL